MKYIECLDELKLVLNTPRDKDKIKKFNDLIEQFNHMGKSITTKFIRGLLSSKLDNRQKTKRISYIVSKSKFKIERITKDIKKWMGSSWNTDIQDFSYSKGFILTEYDRINQLNSSRINNINLNTNQQRVGSSFIGLKGEVLYLLV